MPDSNARAATELRMSTFRLARRLRSEIADDELSDAQFSVLAQLHMRGPLRLGQLAELERVSPPSMNRTVNGLESSGYLSRTADETDRRSVNLALTETGAATVDETVRRRDAWLATRLGELSAEERATLDAASQLMRKLVAQ